MTTAAETPANTNNAKDGAKEEIISKIQNVLTLLRPYLQGDGGDVEFVDVTDEGIVKLRLHGACGTCPSSIYTLKMGIEEQLKQHVEGVKEVQQVE